MSPLRPRCELERDRAGCCLGFAGGALVIEIDGSAYSGNMTITNSEMWNHTDLGRECR